MFRIRTQVIVAKVHTPVHGIQIDRYVNEMHSQFILWNDFFLLTMNENHKCKRNIANVNDVTRKTIVEKASQ